MSYTSQSMPNVYDLDVTNIQEVISYCEARFRAALKVITSPNYYTNREIYCKTLASELVYLHKYLYFHQILTFHPSNYVYQKLGWHRL
jgi:hypothetical protein